MEKVILFASGKGGVGKTTVCANIAMQLARGGKRVLVIDADIYLRNMDLVLGVSDITLFDIQDLYEQYKDCTETMIDIDKEIIVHPLCSNLFFLASPAILRIQQDKLYPFLIKLALSQARLYDYIFVDCPAGLYALSEYFISRHVGVLVVTTPEIPSIRDADRVRECVMQKGAASCRLLVNRVVPKLIRRKKAPNIDHIIDAVGAQLIGLIPEVRNASVFTYKNRLMVDDKGSDAYYAFQNIAARIDGCDVPLYHFW